MSARKNIPLVFLKLGGSLLGDKSKPRSFRTAVVRRLGGEIRRALDTGRIRILLAHGGGGAAHYPAHQFRTREGLPGGGGWRGFAETRRGVLEMNRRVLDALAQAGVFPVLVPPVAGVVCENGSIRRWDLCVIERLLHAGQMPMVHGDVVLDSRIGFTIASTEELFQFLAPRLRPDRVVLACDVKGVYLRVPGQPGRVVGRIDPHNIREVIAAILKSAKPSGDRVWDVTGSMSAKVEMLYGIVRRMPGLEARIVSGLEAGAVESALLGGELGTAILGRRAGSHGSPRK